MVDDFAFKVLLRKGFMPEVRDGMATITTLEGTQLSVGIRPDFHPFSFLYFNLKRYFPRELAETVYVYLEDTLELKVVEVGDLDEVLNSYGAMLRITYPDLTDTIVQSGE